MEAQLSAPGAVARPRGEAAPFVGAVPDFVLCDRQRAGLFGALGRERGLFHDVACWPDIRDVLRGRSAALLAQQGERAWEAQGGVRDAQGLGFRASGGPAVAAAMRALAAGPGGFLWARPGAGLHVRAYGPEPYLELWRQHLAGQANFIEIEGGTAAAPPPPSSPVAAPAGWKTGNEGLDLALELRRRKVRQKDLASHLNVSPAFVCQLLRGAKRAPAGLLERVRHFLAGAAGG